MIIVLGLSSRRLLQVKTMLNYWGSCGSVVSVSPVQLCNLESCKCKGRIVLC